MKNFFYLFILFTLLLVSCKKNKLEGESKSLIGTWNWVYSDHSYGWCDNLTQEEQLSPETIDQNFSFRIFEKGKIDSYKNDTKTKNYRIVFDNFSKDTAGTCFLTEAHKFGILLDNENSNYFWGCVNSDTIECASHNFPFKWEVGCENYWNYFVKQ